MSSGRLTRWTLLAGVAACSSQASPPGSAEQATYATASSGAGGSSGNITVGGGASGMVTATTGTASTTTGATSTGSGTGGNAGAGSNGSGRGGSGSDGDASADGSVTTDASSAETFGVVGVNDAARGSARCNGDRLALGSSRLFAGGATPTAFADAYNFELQALTTAGPLLVALSGISSTSGAQRADLGALAQSARGGATFADGHASIPFSIDDSGTIRIAVTEARFGLEFVAPATSVLLPVVAVSLDSALETGCGALTVTKMKLLVPEAAGSSDFHGSTVAELMGPASEVFGGGSANAWPLELSGTAQQVFAPGAGTDDGGIAP